MNEVFFNEILIITKQTNHDYLFQWHQQYNKKYNLIFFNDTNNNIYYRKRSEMLFFRCTQINVLALMDITRGFTNISRVVVVTTSLTIVVNG